MSGLVAVGEMLVPMDQVERATPMWESFGKHADPKVRLQGKSVSLSPSELDMFLMRPTQLIPALAGTYVLNIWIEEGSTAGEVYKSAVVAWALCFDGEVRPVTPYGVNGGHSVISTVHVELPDGSVRSTSVHDENPTFDNVEAYRLVEGARKLKERADQAARTRAAA